MLSCSLERDGYQCQSLWGQAGLFQRKLTHKAKTPVGLSIDSYQVLRSMSVCDCADV